MNIIPDFAPASPRLRADGWTPERKRAFIDDLAEHASVRGACNRLDMSVVGAYRLRQHPSSCAFAAAWDAALAVGMARLTDVAMTGAVNGQSRPVIRNNKIIGSETVYDNKLLMFLLSNRGWLSSNRFAAAPHASLHNPDDRFGDAPRRARRRRKSPAKHPAVA